MTDMEQPDEAARMDVVEAKIRNLGEDIRTFRSEMTEAHLEFMAAIDRINRLIDRLPAAGRPTVGSQR